MACGSCHEGRWTQGMKSVWPAQLLWKYQEPAQPGFTIFRGPEGPRGSPAGPQPRSPRAALAAATSLLPDLHFLCRRGCQENPPMTPGSHLESCEEAWLKETTPTSRSPGRAGPLGLHNLILLLAPRERAEDSISTTARRKPGHWSVWQTNLVWSVRSGWGP